VLLALSPVLWLAMSHGLQYHRGIMTAVLCYTLADLSALRMILRGVGKDWRGRFVVLFFAAALIPAGAQKHLDAPAVHGRPSQHYPAIFTQYRRQLRRFRDAQFRVECSLRVTEVPCT